MKDSNIKWYDKFFLDSKRWRIILYTNQIIGLILFGGLLTGSLFVLEPTAKTIVSSVMVVICVFWFTSTFLLSFLRNKRFKKFNSTNHAVSLLEAYKQNSSVKSVEQIDNSGDDKIQAEILPCVNLIKTFWNPTDQAYKLQLQESELVLHYAVSTVQRQMANTNRKLVLNSPIYKAIIFKLPSLIDKTFYVSQNSFKLDLSSININNKELKRDSSIQDFAFLQEENSQANAKVNMSFIKEFLFASNNSGINFDFYNDSTVAYLVAYVPSWFMNLTLEDNDSILEFDKKCTMQAEYDLSLMKYLDKIMIGVKDGLIKK